ncbi:PDDEXK nuclease domain-containing protein [Thiocapsa marina]|uniref:DUF1016 domain-containing protein n=1 Tax=Thiocapsa marina 5811 TaxID=768671 RepID=F9UDC5_9GAMM|nr:PDDEXK nuclease domain-containing protein [Thiocapsa marina]EGV17869.1 protein of unknown function DUF1016 [Thiocapsa marina 5811]
MKTPESDPAVASAPEYSRLVEDLKVLIVSARVSAATAVNRAAILLYWEIGRAITERQRAHGWGDSVVEMVAAELRRSFPATRSFSADNVWRMRQFYLTYADAEVPGRAVPGSTLGAIDGSGAAILGHAVPETKTASTPDLALLSRVPWGHHLLLIKKTDDPAARLYYLRATARLGWSRNVLLNQIKAGAYERARVEKKTHNFDLALPEHLSEQAEEMLKSAYNLEFLGLRQAVQERELEDRLIQRLRDFLLELGYGFCFVGRQYRLVLGEKEYFIDLLFYHRFLRALVAFELKVGPFEPEHAGKMDFYLNLLNDTERPPEDNPSIGIILCAEKDDVEVEYALRSKANPIGVATYELHSRLPGELKGRLPSAEQLAAVVRAALPAEL